MAPESGEAEGSTSSGTTGEEPTSPDPSGAVSTQSASSGSSSPSATDPESDTDPTGADGSTSASDTETTGSVSDCPRVRLVGLGGETLNVRAEANVSSEIVGTLSGGQIVDVLGEETGSEVSDPAIGSSELWYEIDDGASTGYITALYAECVDNGGGTSQWVWPTPMTLSIGQDYGNPIDYQSCGFHTGLDIGGNIGDPLVAVADGVVVHVGPMWFSGTGQGRGPFAIIVQHEGDHLYSTYGHNDAAWVEVGDTVTAGETIADMGTLGYSSGPHLHFEMVEGQAFTGDWQVPFESACDAYRDPKDYVSP